MYKDNRSLWHFGFMLLAILLGAGLLAGTSAFAGDQTSAPYKDKANAQYQIAPNKAQPAAYDEACGGAWSFVSSPNPGQSANTLNAVDAISANDAWAVGAQHGGPMIQHWDGTRWTYVPSPNVPGATYGVLFGVAAVSANDVWAVGEYGTTTTHGSLVLRWNGSAWNIAPAPNAGGLIGITALSSNDVWAINGEQTFRWNGAQWSAVGIPTPPGWWLTYALTSITAISANDAWAVGYVRSEGDQQSNTTLILHWNGTQWNVVSSYDASNSSLSSVIALSANDVWAVGTKDISFYPGVPGFNPLLLHWNGQNWTESPTSFQNVFIEGVATTASNNVWVTGISRSTYLPIMLHWDGVNWSNVPVPNVGATGEYADMNGIATSGSRVWAVGSYGPYRFENTLILQGDGNQVAQATSANIHYGYNSLRKLDALASNDVWAVGQFRHKGLYGATGSDASQVLHWDGTKWNLAGQFREYEADKNLLFDVDAVSANDVWVVGHYFTTYPSDTYKPLAIHWDGTAWNVMRLTEPDYVDNYLRGVSGIAADDVWAVGYDVMNSSTDGGISFTRAQHWNGSEWTTITTPSIEKSALFAVEMVATNDVWAVGNYKLNTTGPDRTLIEHWDGVQWTTMPSPNIGPDNNVLRDVSARAAHDVWAVGYYGPAGAGHALILHWDGIQWNTAMAPNVGEYSYLQGVDAVSANNVWAVGNYFVGGVPRALTLHWDGSQWKQILSPNTNSGASTLFGVAALPGQPIWAVGEYNFENGQKNLVERNAPVVYPDVPTNNTFYPYVQCLACKGVDSGYACGGQGEPCDSNSNPYYRPNALITRENIARMVAASAGFSENVGAQIFQDVPATNPYYEWIQRMASRGLIGGYPCGTTPTEPCVAPNNRPYFRPSANATRGQIAKIVSNGAGFNEPYSYQIYQDVPTSQTFHIWIQRLSMRGVMGGYPCGGANEPCVAPDLKPYFRWGNNATRGQTAKITSNTFFPNCAVDAGR